MCVCVRVSVHVHGCVIINNTLTMKLHIFPAAKIDWPITAITESLNHWWLIYLLTIYENNTCISSYLPGCLPYAIHRVGET